MRDFNMILQTLSNVVQLPKFKMAAIKPEVEITLNCERLRRDSKFYSIFSARARLWQCRHCPTWLVSGIPDGGHHFQFRWLPSSISVIGRRRTMSTEWYRSQALHKIMGVELKIATPPLTVQTLFPVSVAAVLNSVVGQRRVWSEMCG